MLLPLLLNLDLIVHGHRRRGKRVRYKEIIEEIESAGVEVVSERYARNAAYQQKEIARLRAEHESAVRAGIVTKLAEIESQLDAAEEELLQFKDEEDFILVIALSV